MVKVITALTRIAIFIYTNKLACRQYQHGLYCEAALAEFFT
jgi:hypothetical protein